MDVIVVGGGPVGLMVAALLDTAGVRVEVFERGDEKSEDGSARQSRGSTTHPRTLEVFTMLETEDGRRLSEVLLAQGRPMSHAQYAVLPDQLDYRGLDTPFPFVLMIAQWRTELALARLLRSRGVPVHYGCEVSDIAQSDDEVRVLVDGTWHTARYVIGADGAHSTVRKAAGISFPGAAPTSVGFVADVRVDEPLDGPRYYWSHEAGMVGLVPMTGATARVFGHTAADAEIPPEQMRARQAEPLGFAELTEAVTAICGSDLGVHSPSWLSRVSNSSRHAATYRTGRILLVGDAGHVHLPAGGQGMNVGLQDAANLAWKLAAEIQGWAPDRLVTGQASYEAERRPVAARLLADTQAQDALMLSFNPATAALRHLFSSLIARGGEVTDVLAGSLSGLAVAYPGQDADHPLVGTRAPDLEVAGGTVLRTLRPDRFLLLDLTADGSLAHHNGARVEVRAAPRPTDPRRAAWQHVRAALIRPDGYVAHAASDETGLADALAAWTEPDRDLASVSARKA